MLDSCNVDGSITGLADARVPVMDRGFLFGDSVYEVARTRRGVPFAWPEHMERLQASAEALGLPVQPPQAELAQRVAATLAAARADGDVGEAYVRVIVTRGTGSAPNIDMASAPGPSRCVLIVRAAPPLPTRGARLAIVDRLRVDRRALDPAIKSGNYLNNVMGLMEARRAGADDCAFMNGAGEVTEASTSNLFVVCEGEVRTPPLRAGILAGITRRLILEVCAREGIPAVERTLTADDLRGADEVFLSSTLRDIWPVTALDGHELGQPGSGSVVTRLAAAFEAYSDQLLRERYAPIWTSLTRTGE